MTEVVEQRIERLGVAGLDAVEDAVVDAGGGVESPRPVGGVEGVDLVLDHVTPCLFLEVGELHEKAAYFRKSLTELGFDLGKSNTHIMPVMCFDERKALFMHVALLENGVYMIPIVYPGCKKGEERLRVNVTRGHTREDMDQALELLDLYGQAFFVQSKEDLGPME